MDKQFAPFSSDSELVLFQNQVRDYLLGKGYKQAIFDNDGSVVLDNSTDQKFGVWNIAQMCAQSPVGKWDEIISDHFERVFKMKTEAIEYDLKKDDFEKIKSDLRLQLYPYNYLDQLDSKEEVMYKSDIPGTLSIIVIDLPSSVQTLKKSDWKVWDISEEEIFKIALSNTLKSVAVNPNVINTGETELKVLEGEDILTAVQILNLESFSNLVGSHGSLVSIPTRHLVLSYPIENLGVIKAVQMLGIITVQANQAGPGSLSPLIYWYQNKSFTDLPYIFANNKFDFTPPPEFISELNLLK